MCWCRVVARVVVVLLGVFLSCRRIHIYICVWATFGSNRGDESEFTYGCPE